MASSITLKSNTHNSRYFELKCTQEKNSSAENSSKIKWTLSAIGDSTWYSTGPTKVIIDGNTVYSKDRVAWSAGTFPVAQGSTSGEITIKHDNDGAKKIKVAFSTAIYTSTVTEYSDTWTLDSIPRYGTSVQSLNDKTETTIKMNWSSDSTVDYLQYSKDNGANWTGVNVTDGKSGTYTISGLKANTEYKIKTRVRRKDSQLTTDSSALSVTTYDYPYCTDSPNFIIGNELTLKFYNPLKRAFKFYIIGNGTQIDVEYNCSTTSYTGVNSTTSSVPYLYATIPNAKSGKYKVKVVYGDSTKTRDNGNTYTIKESECYPKFTAFTYKDANDTVSALTGNDKVLVSGLSKLAVEISATNKMVAVNGANPKNYVASIDTTSLSFNYSTSTINKEIGVVHPIGTPNNGIYVKRLNVTAYDTRSLSKVAYKDITIYDYSKPKINVSVKRHNNFEAQTTLKVSGEYSRLTIDGVDKNTIQSIKYRYRETDGTWTDPIPLTATLSSGKFTCNDVVLTLDNTKSFEFEVSVTDKLSTSTEPATVDIGQAIFFISTNKKTAFINGEEVASTDNVRQTKYYSQLAPNTDLDRVTDYGTYRSVKKADTDTMSNVPSGISGGFTLHVVTWTSTPTDTTYIRQELIYSRFTYVRASNDEGATWSPWNATAYIEDIYPVGSVYCNSTNTNPASKLGGVWELKDKSFRSFATEDSEIFTPASNVSIYSAYLSYSGATVRVRLMITINSTMNDTGMALGKFNWDKVGFTNLPMGFESLVAYSDAGNGGIVYNIAYTGAVNQIDVFDVATIESGKVFALDVTFTVTQNGMDNDFCDKFYWERIK